MRKVATRILCTIFASACLFGTSANATDLTSPRANGTTIGSRFMGFVKVAEGRELYAEYERATPGKPTIVLLNGLTYRLGYWDAFTSYLRGKGYGILRYDPAGMGMTLLRYAPATQAFPLVDQSTDLNELLNQLQIRERVHLVGLSYGGALGMKFSEDFPHRVAKLILMAPFVAALEGQDTWIKLRIQQNRLLFPYNPATYDELYDFYLRQIVYSSYPVVEPVVLENPFKLEAVFRLVQGARRFLAKDIVAKLPPAQTHLMIARNDQYIENAIHEAFWSQLPQNVRGSRLYIEFSEHKIPEAVPGFSASWVLRIIEGDPVINSGGTFVGNPLLGTVVSDQSGSGHRR